MDVGDDNMREGFASSHILNIQKSNQDALSAEDVAWVESCLDSDILDSDWTSMKDALLDIFGTQPDLLNSTSVGADDMKTTDIEILPSSVEAEPTHDSMLGTDNEMVSIDEEAENSDDDIPKSNKINSSQLQNSFNNAFLPGCADGMLESEIIDSGFDLGFSTYDVEVSIDDIFKVWDLDIPVEEDELVGQLKKAFAGSSFKLTPSISDDSSMCKEVKEDTLDDLIAGITGLSLNRKSG